MPRLLAIRIKLDVSITLYDLFCFQWTASGQTGPGEAAQESVAMGLRVELGTFHSLQCMEAPIAQGNQLAHRAVIHKSANLVKVSFHSISMLRILPTSNLFLQDSTLCFSSTIPKCRCLLMLNLMLTHYLHAWLKHETTIIIASSSPVDIVVGSSPLRLSACQVGR